MSWRGSTGHIDANVPDYQKMLQGRYPSSGWSSTPSAYASYSTGSQGASQSGHYMNARHSASTYDIPSTQHNYLHSYQPSKYGITSESSYNRSLESNLNTLEIEDDSKYHSERKAFVDKNYGILAREFDLGPYRSRKTTDYSSDSGTRRTHVLPADYSSDSGMNNRRHRPRSAEFELEIPSPETSRSYARVSNEEMFTSPVKSQMHGQDFIGLSDNQSSYNEGSSGEHFQNYSLRTETISSSDTSHGLHSRSLGRDTKANTQNNDTGPTKDDQLSGQDNSHDSDGDNTDQRPNFFSPPLYKGDINDLNGTTLTSRDNMAKAKRTNDLTHWQRQHQQAQQNSPADNHSPRESSYRPIIHKEKHKSYRDYNHEGYHHQESPLPREQNGQELSPRQQTTSKQMSHFKNAAEAIIRDKDAIIEDLRGQLASKLDMIGEYENKLRRAVMSRGGNADRSPTLFKMQELEYTNAELQAEVTELRRQKDRELEDLEIKLGGAEHEVVQLKSALKKAQPNVMEMKDKLMEKEKEVEDWKDKCSSLSKEYEELKGRCRGLQNYLTDLPTIEDFTKTAEELASCREENDLKADQISDLEKRLEETTQMLTERETTILELEGKQQQLGSKMRELSTEIYRIKTDGEGKALCQTQEELADTRETRDRLATDLEKAKKLLETTHRRMRHLEAKNQSEQCQLRERLTQEEEAVMALREEVRMKEEQIDKLKRSSKEFASKNQDLMDENLMLKEQLQQVERMSDDDNMKLQRRFFKEMSVCFTELQSLVQICVQRAEGKDPNISLLLGMKGMSLDEEDSAGAGAGAAYKDDKSLKHWFAKLKELRAEVEQVRKTICNKYAEEMGDNLNCATQ